VVGCVVVVIVSITIVGGCFCCCGCIKVHLGTILSRLGKKVVILEQHTVIGGGSHMFELGKYKFDAAFQYTIQYLKHYVLLRFC